MTKLKPRKNWRTIKTRRSCGNCKHMRTRMDALWRTWLCMREPQYEYPMDGPVDEPIDPHSCVCDRWAPDGVPQ